MGWHLTSSVPAHGIPCVDPNPSGFLHGVGTEQREAAFLGNLGDTSPYHPDLCRKGPQSQTPTGVFLGNTHFPLRTAMGPSQAKSGLEPA